MREVGKDAGGGIQQVKELVGGNGPGQVFKLGFVALPDEFIPLGVVLFPAEAAGEMEVDEGGKAFLDPVGFRGGALLRRLRFLEHHLEVRDGGLLDLDEDVGVLTAKVVEPGLERLLERRRGMAGAALPAMVVPVAAGLALGEGGGEHLATLAPEEAPEPEAVVLALLDLVAHAFLHALPGGEGYKSLPPRLDELAVDAVVAGEDGAGEKFVGVG